MAYFPNEWIDRIKVNLIENSIRKLSVWFWSRNAHPAVNNWFEMCDIWLPCSITHFHGCDAWVYPLKFFTNWQIQFTSNNVVVFFNLVRLEHFSGDRFQQQLLILLQIKLKPMSRLTSYMCCCFRLGCCSMSDVNRLLLPTPNESENSFQSLLFYVSCLI